MIINKYTFLLLLAGTFLLSCNNTKKVKYEEDINIYNKPISIKNRKFVDASGREVIFSGINLVNKEPKQNYIGSFDDPELFDNFKKWGFNIIRLGIIWDGVEPEPGIYNDDYLKRIDKQIELARKNGLFVFLDMHQDLFSVNYADGAPEWATLTEGKPHYKGSVWSDSYLISPAVQTAWDNFWNNTPASDGIGLQDHYAAAWKHVAERYKGNNVVVGYDLMNEPFVGSEAQMYLPVLFNAFSEVVNNQKGKNLSVEEIAALWENTDSRYKALKMVEDREKYGKVISSVYRINSKFEKGLLQQFYQKVADSIRTVDMDKIIFFNHSYFCNMGVPTALEHLKLKNGKDDPNVAYAAHAYDLLVDTKYLPNSSFERLEFIYENIDKSAKRMNVPVLIGEWGAFGQDQPGIPELAHKQFEIFEKYKFSDTYWAYFRGIEKRKFLKSLIRPYPYFIAGDLVSYHYDFKTGDFTCVWKEDKLQKHPTTIFVPDLDKVNLDDINLKPEGNGVVLEVINKSNSGYITIYPTGKGGKRKIIFNIRNNDEKDISLN